MRAPHASLSHAERFGALNLHISLHIIKEATFGHMVVIFSLVLRSPLGDVAILLNLWVPSFVSFHVLLIVRVLKGVHRPSHRVLLLLGFFVETLVRRDTGATAV